MKQKEIFMEYLNNTHDNLQEEIRVLQQRVRYRECDVMDCVELLLAIERLNVFDEFSRNAKAILQLTPYDFSVYAANEKSRIVRKRSDKNDL